MKKICERIQRELTEQLGGAVMDQLAALFEEDAATPKKMRKAG